MILDCDDGFTSVIIASGKCKFTGDNGILVIPTKKLPGLSPPAR